MSERTCDNPECLKPFEPRRSWQRYCSEACRVAADRRAVQRGRTLPVWDRERACRAAEQACSATGEHPSQEWVEHFILAYERTQ